MEHDGPRPGRCHVRVEHLDRLELAPASPADVGLADALDAWGHRWVTGSCTVDGQVLTVVVERPSGAPGIEVDLRDVLGVQLNGARLDRTVAVVTARHRLHLRVVAPAALARALDVRREAGAAREARAG